MRQLLIASLLLTSALANAETECARSAEEFPTKAGLVTVFNNVNPFVKWVGPLSMASIGPTADKKGTYIELGKMAKTAAASMVDGIKDEAAKKTVVDMLAAANASSDSRAPFEFQICMDDDKKPYLLQLGNKTYFSDDRKTLEIAMPGMPKAKFSRVEETAAAK